MKPLRIVVVGAGLAGLGAAYELQKQSDVELTVVEERDRVGGRVFTGDIHGHPVDMGGFIIYPWYKHYHRLLQELGLESLMNTLPLQDIYYQIDDTGKYYKQTDIPFPKKDLAILTLKLGKKVFAASEAASPPLASFGYKTVAETFRMTLDRPDHAGLYETYTDVITQGYCYPPAAEFKMAFVAPFIRRAEIGRDVGKWFFIPSGNQQIPQVLARAITRSGHRLLTTTKVTGCTDHTLHTTAGEIDCDVIVFAQNVEADVYQQILPDVSIACHYTHYYTMTVQLTDVPVINGDKQWGALFNKPDQSSLQITSAVNLATLYHPDLSGYINCNIVIRDQTSSHPWAGEKILAAVNEQLLRMWPNRAVAQVAAVTYWPKTMPLVQEQFVAYLREHQGEHGYYFAGDFLGAPSMETALATGVQAAEHICRDQGMKKTTLLKKQIATSTVGANRGSE